MQSWFAGIAVHVGDLRMKPASFDYARPETVDEAVSLLASHGDDAKVLAGGQSLVPLLNFRMLRPRLLVDINRVGELDHVGEDGERLRIGALTRHYALETSPLVRSRFPVVAAAMAHVAHLAIRNRGTIGGSLSHADPAAELPMIAVLLDAEIHTRSAEGERRHQARDFFLGTLSTVLAEDELVTDIVLPLPRARTGWGFAEFAQRAGDFAVAAAAATIVVAGGKVAEARLALTGVDEKPLRLPDAEAALVGERVTPVLAADIAQMAGLAVRPNTDLRASAGYRRHLVAALTEQVVTAAWTRALDDAA
jgi:carbon-monoxide dehydrogenase medium subunit